MVGAELGELLPQWIDIEASAQSSPVPVFLLRVSLKYKNVLNYHLI